MDKIRWCLKKRGGIELVEPNRNLTEAYMKKAEEALESMSMIKKKDWKITTAYYAMYFSAYSILMRLGVKCEIHSCTIEFAKRFLKDYLSREDIELLGGSFKARIDAQYYVDRDVPGSMLDRMVKNAPRFLAHCRSVSATIDDKTATGIRAQLKTRS